MTKKVKVSAPGKIILSGEHGVVYGYPAILAAVNCRLSVEVGENRDGLEIISSEPPTLVKHALKETEKALKKKIGENLRIKIDSQVPASRGMGSSAALAVALAAALFKFLNYSEDKEEISKVAYEIEKKQHGNPSGGDNTVSTYGGFLWFRKETEKFKVFSRLKVRFPPKVFLIDSGRPEETTGRMVAMVKETYSRRPRRTREIFREMEEVAREMLSALLEGEYLSLGDLLTENEKLLEKLGVVSPKTQSLIRKIEKIGGGVKISGAGGKKESSGILLSYHQDPDALRSFARREKLPLTEVLLGEGGVRNENLFF